MGKKSHKKEKHLLRTGKLTLTRHCRLESKNLDGNGSISRRSSLLQAVGCPKEVGGKKGEERSRRRLR